MLCDRVKVGKNAIIDDGCLISFGVMIGAGKTLIIYIYIQNK